MKLFPMSLAAVAVGWLCTNVYSDEQDQGGTPPRLPERSLTEMLERFDKNKDGRLDEAERAAAMRARQGFMRNAAAPNLEQILRRFDRDGDGQLNEQERAAARQAVSNMFGRGPGGFAPPPAGGASTRKPRVDQGALLTRFDKDRDGKLDEGERAAARAALQGREKSLPATP